MNKNTSNNTKANTVTEKKINKILQERYNNLLILNPSPRIPKESSFRSTGITYKLK